MNNLSWFIYLTQIVDNLSTAAGIVLIAGIILCALGIPAGLAIADDVEFPAGIFRRGVRAFVLIMGIATCVAIFTPDRRTMLLIAGSEIGQRAATSQAAQEIINPGMDLLKTWIKRETEKLASEANK